MNLIDKKNKIRTILAIETSCDETSAAIAVNGNIIKSNIIASQISTHQLYGGVVPEIASRLHIEIISQVIDEALQKAGMTFDDIDAIGVTYGPGLVGALLVGVSYAKALAFALDKPLIPVNHMEGHIAAAYLGQPDFEPPFLCITVSGGHTQLVKVRDYQDIEVLGETLDDAIGEAFDKIARVLGLGYPGGPKIDKLAKQGNPYAIDFPKAYLDKDSYDFSFSGLKSAVINYLNQKKMKKIDINKADVAASFQRAAIDIVVEKALRAAKELNIKKITAVGGVAANTYLRDLLTKSADENNYKLKLPAFEYCTDNAAMIAAAAYYINPNDRADMTLNATANLHI